MTNGFFGKIIIRRSHQRFPLFIYVYLHCFFYHCDMVQSFSLILSLVSRMYIFPLALIQSTTNSIIIHIVQLKFSWGHVTLIL